jgi:hypothetical protein
MPNFRRGPLRPENFFEPSQPFGFPQPVVIVPASANLNLDALSILLEDGVTDLLQEDGVQIVLLDGREAPTFAPTVSTPRLVTPAKASLVLTEFTPTVNTPRLVTPAARALILSPFAPTVATPRLVTPALRALTLTTFAPGLTITAHVQITPATASLVLSTFAPILTGITVVVVTPPFVPIPTQGEFGHVVSDTGRRLRFPLAPEFQPVIVIPRSARLQLATFAPMVAVAEGPVDITEVYTTLYAAGSLSDEEFVALIAA